MDLQLKDKVALITGGSHGIGLATAHALGREGCRVVLIARDYERLQRVRHEIAEAYLVGVLVIQADATTGAAGVLKSLEMLERSWGWDQVDILVNNVGGGGRSGGKMPDTGDDVWDAVYRSNMGAAIAFTRLFLPGMVERGWGRIVCVSSIHGREAGGKPWLAAAKAAQIAMMKSLSQDRDLVRHNITFNTVAPGSLMIPDTGWGRMAEEDPEGFKQFCESLPLGRLGTAEEVAAAIAFLCSEPARHINGACLVVDGGESRAF